MSNSKYINNKSLSWCFLDGFIAACIRPLLLALGLFCVSTAFAGMSFKSPLSSSQVRQIGGINSIAQDRHGFIWLAGEVGLGRYDGSELRVFEHQPKNPSSLISSYIRKIKVASNGTLWVATESGICRYLDATEQFDCDFSWPDQPEGGSSMQALAFNRLGNLYVGGRAGLFFYNGRDRQLTSIPFISDADEYRNSTVVDLLMDGRGFLWIATAYNGLFRYHPVHGVVQHIQYAPNGDNATGLVSDKTKALLMDSQGRLWVGTYGGGISVFSADGEHIVNYNLQSHGSKGFTSNVIWDIYEDQDNVIWIAMDQGGLVQFDEAKQRFYPERHRPHDVSSLASDQARVIFEDANRDMWVGTFDRGVSFFNHGKKRIQTYRQDPKNDNTLSHSSILALLRGAGDVLWVGTEDGLNALNTVTGNVLRYTISNTSLPAKAVLSIAQMDERTLWLGTWSGGLVSFDIPTGEVTALAQGRVPAIVERSRFVWDILNASDGSTWLASELNGLIRLTHNRTQAEHYQAIGSNPSSISHDFIWRIIERKNGDIMLGTHGGLDSFISAEEGFKHWLINSEVKGALSKRITALFENHDQSIWVGTQDQGVFWLSPEGEVIKHFGRAEGMPALTASAILDDSLGRIWVATINGLVLIDPATLELSVFTHESGLAGNNFNRNAFIRGADGYFYIGGADGLNRFKPEELKPQDTDFPVYVTGFSLLNERVSPGAYPLEASTLFSPTIHLNHQDLMIALSFTALNYRDASTLSFAYRLEGFDNDWRAVGDNRTATYTNIPPGEYQFKVRASRRDGDWIVSNPLPITMKAAPWLTLWAYLGYAVMLILCGGWIANYMNLRGKSRHYRRLSQEDALTGILNRLGMHHAIDTLFENASANDITGLLVIDIDHFKLINDNYGHDRGDQILKSVVEVLQCSVRRSDILGRWGGEEFLLVCPNVDADIIQTIAEKIRYSVEQARFAGLADELTVTVSIGATLFTEQESLDHGFKRADDALYRAKNEGRNRCVYV